MDCKLKDQSGQSTIEFALTLLTFLAFVLFIIQLALISAWGNFVHYATFMSARSYLAAGENRPDQLDRAERVIKRMLKRASGNRADRYPMIAHGVGDGRVTGMMVNHEQTDQYAWLTGIRYRFRSRLFPISLSRTPRAPGANDPNKLELTSESWLGREPTNIECKTSILGRYDNGC